MPLPEQMPRAPAGLIDAVRRIAARARAASRIPSVRVPTPPVVRLSPDIPRVEGSQNGWYVRAENGERLAVNPNDPESLRAVARALVEPR